MEHLRTKILKNLVNILKSNEDLYNILNNRIYANRLENINEDELPCILVYILEETIERNNMGRPASLKRELNIAIEIYVKSENNNDITLDEYINTIAGHIEVILANNHTLDNLVLDIIYNSIHISLNNESSSQKAIGKMNYSITYRTLENNPHN